MSWQSYVDNHLLGGTPPLPNAAIIGLPTETASSSLWACSPGYANNKFTGEEQSAIVEAFSNLDKTRESGVVLVGKKYFAFRADESSIYGKNGKTGCVLVKTNQLILVADYSAEPHVTDQQAISKVEDLADYLKKQGF